MTTSGPLFFLGALHENVAVSLLTASRRNDWGTVHGSKQSIALANFEEKNAGKTFEIKFIKGFSNYWLVTILK